MNDFSAWMQTNWYSLGNLLAQFAFLAGGVWFARKILKTMRATQQQFGALLKLSVTQELEEHSKADEMTHQSTFAGDRPSPYVMAEWPVAQEAPALSLPESEPRRNLLAAAGLGVVRWLQTPIKTHSDSSWRRMLRWLQAPARS